MQRKLHRSAPSGALVNYPEEKKTDRGHWRDTRQLDTDVFGQIQSLNTSDCTHTHREKRNIYRIEQITMNTY